MNYQRTIGIGDAHGCYDIFRRLIEDEIRPEKDKDLLICLGDYIDRGRDSARLIRYLQELRGQINIVFLMGNHEHLALSYLQCYPGDRQEKIWKQEAWFANGGDYTMDSYRDERVHISELVEFIKDLPFFHETDSHIFVHGGIPIGKTLKSTNNHELLWTREFGYTGKPLVVGHTIHKEVTFYPSMVAVDTGAFKTGRLSGYDILNDKIYTAVHKEASCWR